MVERLWNDPNIPRHGWTCIDMEVVEDHIEICQACGVQEIRYVHIMQHPECSHEVRVGCHCASKMELDSDAAILRENKLINKINRKKNWLKDNWKVSKKGNHIKKKEGHIITLFQKEYKWSYSICKKVKGNQPSFSKILYNTQKEAKEAAFEEFEKWQYFLP